MNSKIFRTLMGCSLIHFCIGSVYSTSVLYKSILEITNWDSFLLVSSFSLIIFILGITASFHQKYLSGLSKDRILFYSSFVWMTSQLFILASVFISDFIIYLGMNLILGISIGLLYVLPVNLTAELNSKRTGFYSGVVISCFGLGSLASAKIYSLINYDQLIYFILVCYFIMFIAIKLINSDSIIEDSGEFKRDSNWYLLSIIYFFNIGIGISLLSNLVNLSVSQGLILSVAVTLTAVSGLANTLGRLVYSFISDYIGKINTVLLIMTIQFTALILINQFWYESVLAIISVYGGFFALIPGLIKEIYKDNSKIAYSQILSIWGISGFISPVLFSYLDSNLNLLVFMSLITIVVTIILKRRMN